MYIRNSFEDVTYLYHPPTYNSTAQIKRIHTPLNLSLVLNLAT